MGKKNRARRTADHEARFSTRATIVGLLEVGIERSNDSAFFARVVARLCSFDPMIVRSELESYTLGTIRAHWNSGWQPSELTHQAARTRNTLTGRLAPVAIAADHSVRNPTTLDPRWIADLDRLDLPPVREPNGWLGSWAEREHVEWTDEVNAALRLFVALAVLGPLPVLIPPPGAPAAPQPFIDLTTRTNDPILNRVRALLAKAESSTFDAEAEAFTAKAQELMTRHAIDLAMLSVGADRSEQPFTVRITIDDPYVDAKSRLLHSVAHRSRCRSVFHSSYALMSVIGFAGDVAATEMLFTSILIQAQTAMHAAAAAAAAEAGAHARSRAFRSAFLVAYAYRIGQRLAEVNDEVISTAEAETSRSILPVLAARSADIDATVDAMFGSLRRPRRSAGHDAAGWASGRLAADRAQLTAGQLSPG